SAAAQVLMQDAAAISTVQEMLRKARVLMRRCRRGGGPLSSPVRPCRSARIPATADRIAKSDLSIPELRRDQVANLASGRDRRWRRYWLGVIPAVVLKARLNGASDWKPVSSAMVRIGTSAWRGSASAARAS